MLTNTIPASASTSEDREMSREIWLDEVFPEWKSMFNIEIENIKLEKIG
jgi:hypothetical protein